MENLDLQSTPNPFSAFADSERNRSRRNLWSAAKLLGTSVALFCVVVIGQQIWNDADLVPWMSTRSGAPTNATLQKLCRGAELEPNRIDLVVAAIASEDTERSRLGFQAIETARNEWVTLPTGQRQQNRHSLALALQRTADKLRVPANDERHQRLLKLADAIVQEVLAESSLRETNSPLPSPDAETFDIAMTLVTAADQVMDRFADHQSLP
ncbi:MAG: hypothetical protein AAFX06_20485, partial [Planctomycetota bacterium]